MSAHGGDLRKLAREAGRDPEALLDFSANINPLGPPAWLRPVLARNVADLVHYPEPTAAPLREAAAAAFGVPAATVLAGNGSSEILFALVRALSPRTALIPAPSYSDYARACELAGVPVEDFRLAEEEDFALEPRALAGRLQAGGAVFVGQPNNPTGLSVPRAELAALIRDHPRTLFVVDEAFADFRAGLSLIGTDAANLIVLRSLTKFYAVPGLRLGLAFAARETTARIAGQIPPWSVNTLAQAVGIRALRDREYAEATRATVARLRAELREALQAIPGLRVYPGEANYLFLRLARPQGPALAERLLREHGIAVRDCADYRGLDARFLRVAVRTEGENGKLVAALRARLAQPPARSAPRRRARCLMLQGTCSNAGKSVLSAAFCRLLLQEGYRVAPFKAQNMALNSFVTADGGEMGRAQVMQAQACRVEPTVRMNPVLLKPSSDTGSQVVVMGKPVGTMRVGAYHAYKPTAWTAVASAFDSLAAEYDALVLEGAGSPGEVNLKAHDITNMRMAAYAEAPVLLVGDIDRGGVYAGFVGTMEVLDEGERARIAGFLVNKFRGDATLLRSAHTYIEDFTGKPVLGVVPHLPRLGLPEEDSVSFKAGWLEPPAPASGESVEVALVDLPHISNFTDADPFRIEPDARLRIVREAGELGEPDAVILPGSKNVIGDLRHLERSGLAAALRALAQRGRCEIVGLCAGFQLLGARIEDPHGLESAESAAEGLGLLPVTTVLGKEKILARTGGTHVESGLPVAGYEIHHGRSTAAPELTPSVVRDDGEIIGYAAPEGRIWGTYLHGLFDDDAFRRRFLDRLRARKGLAPLGEVRARYDIDAALDRLAEAVRASVDLPAILRLMGLS